VIRYHANAITAAEVLRELIQLARGIRVTQLRVIAHVLLLMSLR